MRRMTILLTAIALLISSAARAEDKDTAMPDMAHAKAASLFESIKAWADPPIPERCLPAVREMVMKMTKELPEAEKEARTSTRLKKLRANGCIADRYFRFFVGSERPLAYGVCRSDLKPGETVPIPYRISEPEPGVVLFVVSDFQWYDARCNDFNHVVRGMMEQLAMKLRWYEESTVILDLRGNHGGYLSIAEGFLTSIFSPGPGSPMLTVRSRDGSEYSSSTHLTGVLPCPAVILIDYGTASAAEIVGGVLRSWCPPSRMHVVGERSFGKGMVVVAPPGQGFSVLFSTKEFFIGEKPNLVKVEGVGIEPGIAVSGNAILMIGLELAQGDPVFRAALQKRAQHLREALGLPKAVKTEKVDWIIVRPAKR